MRILTPSDNKRINELIGFAGIVVAVMLALSLLSYSPADPSFNVAATGPSAGPPRNWIGPFGAHLADLLFQLCGYTAFLLPVGIFVLGMRWFRSQAIEAPWREIGRLGDDAGVFAGGVVAAAFSRGARRDSSGRIDRHGSRRRSCALRFNTWGSQIVGIACVLTALFLTTKFSFTAAAGWLRKPIAAEGYLGRMVERVKDWREARESRRTAAARGRK